MWTSRIGRGMGAAASCGGRQGAGSAGKKTRRMRRGVPERTRKSIRFDASMSMRSLARRLFSRIMWQTSLWTAGPGERKPARGVSSRWKMRRYLDALRSQVSSLTMGLEQRYLRGPMLQNVDVLRVSRLGTLAERLKAVITSSVSAVMTSTESLDGRGQSQRPSAAPFCSVRRQPAVPNLRPDPSRTRSIGVVQ